MAPEIDRVLHRERSRRINLPVARNLEALPAGAFVTDPRHTAYRIVGNGEIARWDGAGYSASMRPEQSERFTLLTPPSIVATMRAGYVPSAPYAASGRPCDGLGIAPQHPWPVGEDGNLIHRD